MTLPSHQQLMLSEIVSSNALSPAHLQTEHEHAHKLLLAGFTNIAMLLAVILFGSLLLFRSICFVSGLRYGLTTLARLRKLNCGPYDVAASAPRIIENFLDMSHFGFVHEGWLGSRDATAIATYKVESTSTGVLATGCKAVQPQSNLHSTQAAEVEYTYEVTAAYTAVLTKIPEEGSSKQGWREQIGLFICPVTPESSRVWFRLAVADFESTDEQLQTFQHTIFVQDQPVLESQLPKALPLDPRAEMHSAADRMSSAYRRFLKSQNITFGVC